MLCLALAVTIAALPYDLFAPKEDTAAIAQEEQIRAMVDDLRQQVRDAQLTAAAEAELQALLDQLEKDLLATDNELERAALIQQAQQNIEETLFFSISRYAIGRALQNYTLTEGLGKQISGDQPTFISEPMDQLYEDITGPTKQINRLSNNLANALEESGIDPYDSLYIAFQNFSIGISDMLNYTEGPDFTPAWTYEDLRFLFDVAEENILAALEEQAHTEGEMENLSTSLNATLDSLLEQSAGEVMTTEKQPQQGGANNQSSSQNPSGGSDGNPSGTPVGGMFDSGESNSGPTMMLEGIYDPVSGDVTYGEVFAAYYAQYLEALDAGEIPDELRPYFERYFSSLS
jgi:hypothetical protein